MSEMTVIPLSVLAVLCSVAAYCWYRNRKRKHGAENQFRQVWSELLRDYDGNDV